MKIYLTDLPEAGGKNASLGEMFNKLKPLGIKVPDGFAITASDYKFFLQYNKIEDKLKNLLNTIDAKTLDNLPEVARQCREIVTQATLPDDVKKAILQSYTLLSGILN